MQSPSCFATEVFCKLKTGVTRKSWLVIRTVTKGLVKSDTDTDTNTEKHDEPNHSPIP